MNSSALGQGYLLLHLLPAAGFGATEGDQVMGMGVGVWVGGIGVSRTGMLIFLTGI